jgi:hypothetical protein
MRPVLWFLTGLFLLACVGPNGRTAAGEEDRWMVAGVASSLEVGIASDEVRLSFHVTNASADPVSFTFPTSQRHDFFVENEAGERVWQWSGDRVFLQVITEATLEPGETWSMDAAWVHGGQTGRFVGVGRLVAMDRPVEQRAAFELP